MPIFKVEINESTQKVIEIKAKDKDEALIKTRQQYHNGHIDMLNGVYQNYDIEVIERIK